MRYSPVIITVTALLALLVVGAAGVALVQPARPLLADVSFSLARITPNADNADDVTAIRYTLNQTAKINITFLNKATGAAYAFRKDALRPADHYEVPFSGIVDGYLLPGETFGGTLETRLMPNGEYTWAVEAVTDAGVRATATGTLTVAGGSAKLPDLQTFEISPQRFTPNQDGYDDRVYINLYLAKQARLTVYLEGNGIGPLYIGERTEGRKPGEEGAHIFDYDGGLDNKLVPPPDGTYTIVAVAEDAEGQRVRRTGKVTLVDGGQPNAEIMAQSTGRTVTWSTLPYKDAYGSTAAAPGQKVDLPAGVQSTLSEISLPVSDVLIFRMTISNYGTTPLRTIGPWPGTVYDYSQTEAALTPETDAISGAWRIGIECERIGAVYPWRFALGTQAELTSVERENETLWYLMPGKQSVIWGAVRMTRLIKTRNPQKCYAALIHEDVDIPNLQNRVGEIDVKLKAPEQTP